MGGRIVAHAPGDTNLGTATNSLLREVQQQAAQAAALEQSLGSDVAGRDALLQHVDAVVSDARSIFCFAVDSASGVSSTFVVSVVFVVLFVLS